MEYFQTVIVSAIVHLGILILLNRVDTSSLYTPSPPLQIEIVERDNKESRFVTDPETGDLVEELKNRAEYLSKFNRQVSKQTVASKSGLTQNRSNKNESLLAIPRPKFNPILNQSHPNQPHADQSGTIQDQVKNTSETQITKHNSKSLKMGGMAPQRRDKFMPGVSTIAEHIPGVEHGAFTSLNTGQFTFYTFFNRINQQVHPRWESNIRRLIQQMPFSALRQLSLHERHFQVEIILSKDGEYESSLVLRSSGFEELDETALFAFRNAAPFVNPPIELVEEDNKVHLVYQFVVQMGSRSRQ